MFRSKWEKTLYILVSQCPILRDKHHNDTNDNNLSNQVKDNRPFNDLILCQQKILIYFFFFVLLFVLQFYFKCEK